MIDEANRMPERSWASLAPLMDDRRYVECDEYVGPDRRFQNLGPPAGIDGRRDEDKENAAEPLEIETQVEAAELRRAAG